MEDMPYTDSKLTIQVSQKVTGSRARGRGARFRGHEVTVYVKINQSSTLSSGLEDFFYLYPETNPTKRQIKKQTINYVQQYSTYSFKTHSFSYQFYVFHKEYQELPLEYKH